MQIRSASYNPLVSIGAALLSLGLQIAWFIDPVNGNDAGDGTAAAPLKTMDEFNARMGGNYLQVNATLQLIGDVLDAPLQLVGTRLKLNASLTVSGTKTQVGSGQISVVTPIGNAGTTYPFQLTTTGIDWTTMQSGAQITLQGGQLFWIRNVVDANNVIVGAGTLPTSNAFFTPTVGLTFTVATLSRALPPILACSAATAGLFNGTQITLQNLAFDSGFVLSTAGAGVLFIGCEFRVATGVTWENNSQWIQLFRSCRFTLGAGLSFRSSGGRVSFFGGVVATTSTLFSINFLGGNDNLLLSVSFLRITLSVSNCSVQLSSGGVHFENITSGGCILLTPFGNIFATGIANGRNCAGSSAGIDCQIGQYVWSGAAAKPTIGIASGCTADVKLGSGATGLTFTYAQLGTGKQLALLDAVPPTTAQIQAGGYALVAQFN